MSYSSRVLAVVLCAMALSATCVAQTYTNYGILSSSDAMSSNPNWQAGRTWAVDVNNDGIPDLIQQNYSASSTNTTAQFGVAIANGDGTFKPPVGYNYPPGLQGAGVPIAFGDFNGDGKIDLAMWGGYSTVAVYLGNGDGTFQNPWYSNVSLAASQFIDTNARFVAADFNHDGHVDLAIVGTCSCSSANTTLYILPGNGSGLFSNAIPVLNTPNTDSTLSEMNTILVGDYDSDGNADLAVAVGNFDSHLGSVIGYTIHVLYGAGDFSFEDSTPITTDGSISINSGDLNSDGYTDLFLLDIGSNRLDTYYGQPGRTFAAYTQQVPNWVYFGDPALPYPAMADFNDDSHMDLVAEAHDGTNPGFLVFFLATPDLGQFDVQTWNIQANQTATSDLDLAIGDFNGDSKPDWATNFYPATNASITTGLNATDNGNWSNCNYPTTARGISLCSPAGSSTAPVNFSAAAHSFGQLRKMEVWVDGKKLDEQHNTWAGNAFLNFSASSLAAGPHLGTIYAADVDNTLQRLNFNFTVGSSNCAAPPSAGVHICSPTSGSTTSATPVLVQASATIQGALARMEIWVDGVKKYTETNSTSLAASINLTAGAHQFTVYAVNTDGALWDQTVTATVP